MSTVDRAPTQVFPSGVDEVQHPLGDLLRLLGHEVGGDEDVLATLPIPPGPGASRGGTVGRSWPIYGCRLIHDGRGRVGRRPEGDLLVRRVEALLRSVLRPLRGGDLDRSSRRPPLHQAALHDERGRVVPRRAAVDVLILDTWRCPIGSRLSGRAERAAVDQLSWPGAHRAIHRSSRRHGLDPALHVR